MYHICLFIIFPCSLTIFGPLKASSLHWNLAFSPLFTNLLYKTLWPLIHSSFGPKNQTLPLLLLLLLLLLWEDCFFTLDYIRRTNVIIILLKIISKAINVKFHKSALGCPLYTFFVFDFTLYSRFLYDIKK